MNIQTPVANHRVGSAGHSRFDRELEERFIRYARIDTQSDESSTTSPSTKKQYDLLNLLAKELKDMGAHDVIVTNYGAVIATIPATLKTDIPTIALLAHVEFRRQVLKGIAASAVKTSDAGIALGVVLQAGQIVHSRLIPDAGGGVNRPGYMSRKQGY